MHGWWACRRRVTAGSPCRPTDWQRPTGTVLFCRRPPRARRRPVRLIAPGRRGEAAVGAVEYSQRRAAASSRRQLAAASATDVTSRRFDLHDDDGGGGGAGLSAYSSSSKNERRSAAALCQQTVDDHSPLNCRVFACHVSAADKCVNSPFSASDA